MQCVAHRARAVVARVRPVLMPAAEPVWHVGDHVAGLDDRDDRCGRAGGSRREAVGADRRGGRRGRSGLPGRLIGRSARRAAVDSRRPARLDRLQGHGAGHAARARRLLEHAHLARREHAVHPETGRALEQAHARPGRRPELAVGHGRVAEVGERVLQQAHVLAPRPDAQVANAEPAAVARAAALRAAEDVQEPLRHPRRAVEPGVGAQRAHHGRRVGAELPVDLDRVPQAGEHPLQLAHGRPGLAGVQAAQRWGARSASLRLCQCRRNEDAGGEYRNQEKHQRLRRTVWETVGSQHGFRVRQGVSRDASAGRARRRRGARRGLSVLASDPTGGFRVCRGG